jgi:hypothetical protein
MTRPSPLLLRGLVAALIIEHVALIAGPVDVLSPIDPHVWGQWMLHGQIPYRDFGFEYPPLAVLAFLLPALLPHSFGPPVLAVQAAALEVVVAFVVLQHHPGALVRYAALSLLVFPFLSGGFDALPMAAIAISSFLLADGQATGWWIAAAGVLTKISPGVVWVWARKPWKAGIVALVVTAAVALAPAAVTRHPDDSYLGYTLHRGVEAESVAASTAWVVQQAERVPTRIVYRFRSNELPGADGAATVWLALMAIAFIALAVRAGREGPTDPWLASFVALLVLMIGSKVLSPQYVAWPAPLAAVLGGRWWKAWVAVAGLTIVTYALSLTNSQLLALTLVRNVVLVATAVAGLTALLRRSPAPEPTSAE